MASLGAAVDAFITVFEMGSAVTIPGDYPARYTIDSETVYVTGGSGSRYLSVNRGQDDTVPAAHSAGAAFTSAPAGSGGEGGGSLTVDNQVDPPEEVTTLVLPGAVVGGGEASLGADFYAQDTDPGAVGAGAVWQDTTSSPYVAWRRNPTDDGWVADMPQRVEASDGDDANASSTAASVDGIAEVKSIATASGDGDADVRLSATTSGEGTANATSTAAAGGAGTADVRSSAEATTGDGLAFAGFTATSPAGSAGILAEADTTSARMGFNGTAPIARPEVPATPTEQDIVDALVALGLITQAAP